MAKSERYSPLPPWQRTDYCGALRAADEGREVALWGWVQTRRDHGRLIFIDLRDREGIVQLVMNPEHNAAAHAAAGDARSEYYVAVRGKVVRRSEGSVNAELPTGEIEILASDFEILNVSAPLPFQVTDASATAEEIRLKYRYLDLRRPEMQQNLRRRHQALKAVREYLDQNGFVDIETPILFKSTPEGARDYLVPSRVNPGKFYALPQSPQLLKQVLMIGGFDRYYQIARCFRDEDLRANRQPEFSQIDIEMTCPRPEDIQSIAEGMIASVYRHVLGIDVQPPFPRMTYADAMDRFGVDKPDMRFGLELKNLTAGFAGTAFKVFAEILGRGESIYGINVPGAHQLTRRELDELTESVRARYSMGLAWIKVGEQGWQGPIAKYISNAEKQAVTASANLAQGDTLIMVAGLPDRVRPVLGDIRLQLGAKFGLDKSTEWKFLWVVDFPLFDYSDEDQRMVAVNHPFTAPNPDDLAMLESAPLKARALAYDLVLNGQELAGGSIRIHSRELQLKVFELLGLSRADAADRFGFLLDALRFGAPPHGGIAFGVDRICMMLCGTDSLRDVIAFPKTQRAVDPMSGAPSEVDPRQLRELSIKVTS
ncbi:MAG: aspartate--tRNA ligase [Candidatus Binatus sp.]|uniref:aspartate--tRNA ligase n=1 Tax=Candidatus Binatus sp. TaxID=2811406 RepID=UPI002717CD3C|nr:aspartate--tRNA ligase [Candidatus Binatus sp.]MDO8433169.1 aspartate--tRNA ligase [Candidatus Binatus sp.]